MLITKASELYKQLGEIIKRNEAQGLSDYLVEVAAQDKSGAARVGMLCSFEICGDRVRLTGRPG